MYSRVNRSRACLGVAKRAKPGCFFRLEHAKITSMEKNQPFRKIVLIGRQRSDGIESTLLGLFHYLVAKGYDVNFELETAEALTQEKFPGIKSSQLKDKAELLIVIGGDGSLLHAAKIAMQNDLPVLGINRGRLGFLTDMYPGEYQKIEQVLQGNYHEESRFLLKAALNNQAIIALNEIVISPGNIGHMIEFDIAINNKFVCGQRADGLILSTPTGSTAYALSAGGPILHPALNAFVLVPMFPHTLTNRPLVVDANSEVTIAISPNNVVIPFLSSDGQQQFQIPLGESLHVKKHEQVLRLIHPFDYNYFETLRVKLGWQTRHPSDKASC